MLAYSCFLPKKNVSASENNQNSVILKNLQAEIGPDFQYSLDRNTDKTTFISNSHNALPLNLEGVDKNDAASVSNRFMKEYGSFFGVADAKKDAFLFKKDTDSLGITHIRYGQKYNDVPVFGGQIIVHLGKDKNVNSANGEFIPDISIDTDPKISQSEAEDIAKELWKEQKRPENPEVKKSNLYIFNKSLFQNKKEDTKNYLVWKIELTKGKPNIGHEYYFIDAHDGDLVFQITGIQKVIDRMIYDCSLVPLTGFCWTDHLYQGHIYGRSEGQPVRGANFIVGGTDTDNLYTETNNCHNYYSTKFSINGANKLGGIGDGTNSPFAETDGFNYIDYAGADCPNAYFDGYSVNFCKGLVFTDIVGHEYAHAVNTFSILDGYGDPSGLTYSGQPGALNESNSDVFGEALEYFIDGNNDWLLGEDIVSGGMRSMQNPGSLTEAGVGPYPNKFHDSNYYCGSGDDYGVHHNSSVPNHAAYLMAMGGTYNGCAITGIGRTKEEAIFYRAQTGYYTPSTTFNQAYNNLISACGDLYGGTSSADCINVKKALQAVEMDQNGYCSGQPELVASCAATTTPVYRFWSDTKQGHFYTSSATERDSIIATYPTNVWSYEGTAYNAFGVQSVGTTPIYRFWSDDKQHHFFTASATEKDLVIATYPSHVWNYEGIAYYAYATEQPSSTALYRFWSDTKQGHFYTASAAEKDYVIATYPANVWNYEGIAWYVPTD